MTSFQEHLTDLEACEEATEWVADQTLGQAWAACHRGDWMLWLAARLDVDRKLVVTAACACARPALRHIQAGEDRPRKAIETAERWAVNAESVTSAGLKTAVDGAYTAAASVTVADYADYNAASAAYTAANAAANAAAAAYTAYSTAYNAAYNASSSAASAASAADYAADYAADTATTTATVSAYNAESLAHSAGLVRSIISVEAVQAALDLREQDVVGSHDYPR